jgi:hypothetical protein
LIGLGFGLFTGAALVKDELISLDSGLWVVAWLVLYWIGLVITQRAIRRSAAPGTVQSET